MLLEHAHQRGRLYPTADGMRPGKGGHFRAGLREAEDVIDEQQHILAFFISETGDQSYPQQPHRRIRAAGCVRVIWP